jgi:chromate reductase
MKKVIGLTGSLRADSHNLKLLRNILRHLQDTGAYETKLGPTLQLPLFNEELEAKPLDPSITEFRAALKAADIVVIASPEYNGTVTGALKNAIDWASRPPENLWAGKTVVLAAASPGGFAGIRGLIQLRTILSGLKSWVIPDQIMLGNSHEAFDQEGCAKGETLNKQISGVVAGLKEFFN